MQLESIRIENFKRIGAIDLALADLNILVGSNGSGKSSILQALHLASCLLRQADRIRTDSTAMVRVADLDYLPSDEYWRLGHGADWGNKTTSPSSTVKFNFLDGSGATLVTRLEMRSARNAGISVVENCQSKFGLCFGEITHSLVDLSLEYLGYQMLNKRMQKELSLKHVRLEIQMSTFEMHLTYFRPLQ